MSVVKKVSVYNGSAWDTDDIGANASNITTNSTYVGATNVEKVFQNLLPSSTLTKNKVLISNSNGKITTSSITTDELGCLSGITRNIQEQINGISSGGSGASSEEITAINEKIGDVSSLVTGSTVLTDSINTLLERIGDVEDNLNSSTAQIDTNITNITTKIGTGTLKTNSKDLIGAINQIYNNSYKGEIRDVLYQPNSTAYKALGSTVTLSRGDSTSVNIAQDYDYLDIYFVHTHRRQRQLCSRFSTTGTHFWLQTSFFDEIDTETNTSEARKQGISLLSLVLQVNDGNILKFYKNSAWYWNGDCQVHSRLKKLPVGKGDQYIDVTRIEGIKK